jgi:hypothetical protein
MKRNCRHWIILVLALAVGGCVRGQKVAEQPTQMASQVDSPYESYLPQTPLETNRVELAGGSIVRPAGWTIRTIKIEDWFKSSVAAQYEIAGPQADNYGPRFTIQLLGPDANETYAGWLTPGQQLPDGWVLTQFQNQPALANFLPGFGERQAVRDSYQPWLTQYLLFERGSQWFLLNFEMKNADKDKPYYTQPLPIIQQYFETFRCTPAAAASGH